jgi:hypothetical protein
MQHVLVVGIVRSMRVVAVVSVGGAVQLVEDVAVQLGVLAVLRLGIGPSVA